MKKDFLKIVYAVVIITGIFLPFNINSVIIMFATSGLLAVLQWYWLKHLKNMPQRFPTAFHTVDVIATTNYPNELGIILGKKHNSDKWVIFGGFLDPTDDNAQSGGARELNEEGNLKAKPEDLQYLGSFKIDDPRFRNSPDKIITSLYTVNIGSQLPIPGDDIKDCLTIPLSELKRTYKDIMQPYHWPLIEEFFKLTN